MPRNTQSDKEPSCVGEEESLDHLKEESFDHLIDRYYRPISYFFANRGFSTEECRDLTQETFLGVYKGLGRFRRDEVRREQALLADVLAGTAPVMDAGKP